VQDGPEFQDHASEGISRAEWLWSARGNQDGSRPPCQSGNLSNYKPSGSSPSNRGSCPEKNRHSSWFASRMIASGNRSRSTVRNSTRPLTTLTTSRWMSGSRPTAWMYRRALAANELNSDDGYVRLFERASWNEHQRPMTSSASRSFSQLALKFLWFPRFVNEARQVYRDAGRQ
jgi:hypothetical protein